MSLARLRHIVAVARSGSFSIAAEEIGISQPALSRSIQAFEEQYGVRLFDRGKGGVTLTGAGRLAVKQAHGLLAVASDFDRDMRYFGQGKVGRTGVGMGPLMASLLLPRLGKVLLQRSPQLIFLTRVGSPDQMLKALLEGAIELMIGNSSQMSLVPGVTEEQLGILQLAIVVRAGHPLAGAKGLAISDLDRFPAARPFDFPAVSYTSSAGAFICENFSILGDIVFDTDCTWLVAPAFIKMELEQGRLAQLDVTDLPTKEAQISMAYLRGRTRSPAALSLAETVRSMIKEILTV